MKKILINRTDAIGDTLLTTALAKAIKKLAPETFVYFIVSERCRDLIDHCDGVDKAYILPLKKSKSDQKEVLKKVFNEHKFDAYFHSLKI